MVLVRRTRHGISAGNRTGHEDVLRVTVGEGPAAVRGLGPDGIGAMHLLARRTGRVILLGYDAVAPELEKYHRRGQLTHAANPEEAVQQAAETLGETGA